MNDLRSRRAATRLVAGDEWADVQTFDFTKRVSQVMRRSHGVKIQGVNRNKIMFTYSPAPMTPAAPLILTLTEFGYGGQSENVGGMITSPANSRFRVPGGYTKNRDADELWKMGKENLDEIIGMARGRTSSSHREIFMTKNEDAISRMAAAGIPNSVFRSKVYRIVRKIAQRYGGTASGMVAAGDLEDGTRWSATITRTNASNGETFGRLDLTVKKPGQMATTVGEYWDWDKVFERAGIPVVSSGARMSSREASIANKIVADMRPKFDGMFPEDYAAQWGSTKGQGAAHFYNYGSKRQVKDSRFYFQFMNGPGGIKDTLKMIQNSLVAKDGNFTQHDWDEMNKFARFISEEARRV